MHWFYLGVACIFEVIFALGSNAAHGFTRFWPSVLTVLAAAAGIYTLSLALKTIDVGIGYPIWTGVGAIGTVIFGVILFNERINLVKVGCFGSIILGVIGLKMVSGV